VNWFPGQHRLKLKSARPIVENRLIAGTKLRIERIFKNLGELIKSFVFKDVNRLITILPVAIVGCPSMQCSRSWSQQAGTQQASMQASVERTVPPFPFVPIANAANSEIHDHYSFSNTEIRLADQILMKARLCWILREGIQIWLTPFKI
jgi:hypothetical protein